MMRILLWSIAAAAIGGPPAVSAQNRDIESSPRVEAALSNDTFQLRYMSSGSKLGLDRKTIASGGFFLSEDRDIVLSGGVLFPANLDVGRLDFHFGPRVYAALLQDENDDVLSVTLGAQARFLLNRRSGLAVVGEAYYGPDILTFGSGDSLTDLSARAEMQVAERLLAFAGMRWFEFDLTEGGGDRTLQDEVFVGVGYSF